MASFSRSRSVVWHGPGLLTTIYLVIGLLVASTHNYFVHVNTAQEIVSAILSVVLWPLLLFGIGLHVH